MNQFEIDIQKKSNRVRLTAREQDVLRERVISYMEYHPRTAKIEGKKETHAHEVRVGLRMPQVMIGHFVTFEFGRVARRLSSVTFALLLIIVPFVAERAVPGDVLYLVKTGVNETVQEKLATSPYEKIQFETRLIERRIAEARMLASEGNLTEDVEARIEETVKGHASAIKDGLDEMRTHNADEAALATIEVSSSLEIQSAVLDADTTNERIIDSILVIVNDAREDSTVGTEESAPSYDSLIAKVEQETTRAFELGTTVKASATGDEAADIDRRLSDIDRLIQEAKEEHAKDGAQGIEKLVGTLGLIQKLIVFMTDIDVRQSIELETIVPIVLSDEERLEEVDRGRGSAQIIIAEVEARLPDLIDEDLKEKVTFGLEEIQSALLRVDVALDTGNVLIAEESMKEVRAYAQDLDLLIDGILPPLDSLIENASTPSTTDTSTTTASTSIEVSSGTTTETSTQETASNTVETR